MIKESIFCVVRAYRDFNGAGMYMALFYCALLYLWYQRDNQQLRRMWVYPSLFFFVLILNPLIMQYIVDLAFDYASKPRVFWLFPIVCIIALAVTLLVSGRKSTREKVALGFIVCLIMVLCGKFKYTDDYLVKPTNIYDLPQQAIDIADFALEKYENPKLVVPIELATAMRIYSSDIKLLYGEDVVFGRIQYMGPSPYEPEKPQYTVYQCLKEEHPQVDQIIDIVKEFECDYMVFDNELQSDYELIEEYGYRYVKTIDRYDIYEWVRED